jgi:hypothetical protein
MARRKAWEDKILEFNPAAIIKKTSKICSAHFQESDMLGNKFLKNHAIPSRKGFFESLDILADVGYVAHQGNFVYSH